MLVVDASVASAACLSAPGWEPFQSEELIAPPLLVSEAASVLHEARWRKEISHEVATRALDRLSNAPLLLRCLSHPRLAWEIADALGWAKTYDAEYIALARLEQCRLVTLDERLRRGVRGLIEMVRPGDIV